MNLTKTNNANVFHQECLHPCHHHLLWFNVKWILWFVTVTQTMTAHALENWVFNGCIYIDCVCVCILRDSIKIESHSTKVLCWANKKCPTCNKHIGTIKLMRKSSKRFIRLISFASFPSSSQGNPLCYVPFSFESQMEMNLNNLKCHEVGALSTMVALSL